MAIVLSDTWKTAQPSKVSKLVDKVVRLYGLTDDDEAKQMALDFLDETIIEMNTHMYEFNLVQVTSITLVEGQTEYTLPTQFYREKLAYVVDSDGNTGNPLYYLDWPTFMRLYGKQPNEKALPIVYSIRNVHNDGSVSVSPPPDERTATNDTLTVDYYRRIPLASENEDGTIDVPQEVETTLLYGAKKRFAMEVRGADQPDWLTFEELESKALERLKAADRRHPDEITRFRLYDRNLTQGGGQRRFGRLYIRIS
jgi:hypothetical protein